MDGGLVYTRLAVAGKIVKKSFGSLKDPNALAAAVRAANRHHDDKRLGRQGLERPAEHISVERACEIGPGSTTPARNPPPGIMGGEPSAISKGFSGQDPSTP